VLVIASFVFRTFTDETKRKYSYRNDNKNVLYAAGAGSGFATALAPSKKRTTLNTLSSLIRQNTAKSYHAEQDAEQDATKVGARGGGGPASSPGTEKAL